MLYEPPLIGFTEISCLGDVFHYYDRFHYDEENFTPTCNSSSSCIKWEKVSITWASVPHIWIFHYSFALAGEEVGLDGIHILVDYVTWNLDLSNLKMVSVFLDLNLLLVFVAVFIPGHWYFSWDRFAEEFPLLFCSRAFLWVMATLTSLKVKMSSVFLRDLS